MELLNHYDVRDHYKHTDDENDRNAETVAAIIENLPAALYCIERRPASGRPFRYIGTAEDVAAEVGETAPKVGTNAYTNAGALVFEAVDNCAADYITVTPCAMRYY